MSCYCWFTECGSAVGLEQHCCRWTGRIPLSHACELICSHLLLISDAIQWALNFVSEWTKNPHTSRTVVQFFTISYTPFLYFYHFLYFLQSRLIWELENLFGCVQVLNLAAAWKIEIVFHIRCLCCRWLQLIIHWPCATVNTDLGMQKWICACRLDSLALS